MKKFLNWCKEQLKDRKFRITFYIVCVVLYSEVWIPVLIALLNGISETTSKVLLSFATTCAGIWASPLLPFFPVALGLTEVIYQLLKKRK